MNLTVRDKYDAKPTEVIDLGVTLDEAVSFIIEALEDPLNPRWCGPSISACMMVIRHHNTTGTIINGNRLFGSAIVAFLTAKRSIATIETLASRWYTCECSHAAIKGHGIAAAAHELAEVAPIIMTLSTLPENQQRAFGRFGDKNDVLRAMIERFVEYLEDAVRKVKPSSVAKGRHPEIWPATPRDLIPYGPEITVESLVTLSRFMRSAHVFSLVHLFIHMCGPVMVPAVAASRSAPKYMVEHGLKICSDISNTYLDPNGEVTDDTAKTFAKELGYLAYFINGLLTMPPLLNRDLHSGIANNAFDFATQAISTVESPIIPQFYKAKLKPVIEQFANYASALFTTLPEEITVPRAHIHPAVRSIMVRMTTPSPAEFAYAAMRQARSIRFCFAPECPEPAQLSGRVYMRCSGCRVVAYCSTTCQKRAWTHKQLPHRGICKKMMQVYNIGGDYLHQKDSQDKFVREMRRANIKDLMLKEIGVWLTTASTMLQRTDPLLTADAREYLSQREVEGMRE